MSISQTDNNQFSSARWPRSLDLCARAGRGQRGASRPRPARTNTREIMDVKRKLKSDTRSSWTKGLSCTYNAFLSSHERTSRDDSRQADRESLERSQKS